MTVASPSNIQAALIQEYWDNELVNETLQQDVLSTLTTIFDDTTDIAIPNDAIVMQTSLPATGERTATFGFLHALTQAGGEGDLFTQIGNEETLRQKTMTAGFNEFSHAASGWNYGIHYHDSKPYGIQGENMKKATELLGQHAEERFGLYRRQALLEWRSQNLTQSPLNQTMRWNPHWYIKNLLDTQQPTYSTNAATFTARIITALQAAGTGINAALDAHYLLALSNRAKALRIAPLKINGKNRYILTVPSEQTVWASSLDISGSLGAWWSDYSRLKEEKLMFPGLLGEWKNILLVEDERAPTLTIGGSAAPFTLTANYMRYGNDDERDTSAGARQVGFLLGKAPLVEWYPDKIHHEYDDYNYRKWIGKGYFGMIGDTLRVYDQATPTDTSFQQNSCIVCPFARNATYN